MVTNNKSLMLKCECRGAAIEITHWNDDNEFWFSIWKQSPYLRPLRWKERIRWCWNILRTGNPWADDIILTSENAKKVAEFINNNLSQNGKTN